MSANALAQNNWLDTTLYPFKHHYIQLQEGKMHYVDEGKGEVILFVHGTPTWSFLYRNHIKKLSENYRCIAIDHLGFGLSEKPENLVGTPEQHSENLEEFIQKLQLNNINLVVHDFGGPIGLGWANSHPTLIKRLIIFNTWLWETASNPETQKIDKLINSGMGKFLYINMNFSPKVLLKKGFHHKKLLSKNIHKHYKAPFPNKTSRYSLLKIAKSLVSSSNWYGQQWEQLVSLNHIRVLILWGTKDEFITPLYLDKWQQRFPKAKVVTYECGHFVQEEKASETIKEIKSFIGY